MYYKVQLTLLSRAIACAEKDRADISFKTYMSLLSNAVVTLETLDSSKYGEFVRKLDGYQQATGINETTRDQIWSKTIQNGKLLE